MVCEARASVVGLIQPVPLDHGAHGAVDDEDVVVQRIMELGHAVGARSADLEGAVHQGSRWAERVNTSK